MVHRCIDVFDDPNRENRRKVFGAPVVLGSGNRRDANFLQDRPCFLAASELHPFFQIQRTDPREKRAGNFPRDEQRLHGVAGGVALGLRVERNLDGHVEISGRVDVHMTDSVEVLNDRDASFPGDSFDEALSASRYDHVHPLRACDECADCRPIGGLDNLNSVRRESSGDQTR